MKVFATSKKWLFFALVTIFLGLLSGCTAAPSHEWTEAPGWSRARLIGETESSFPVQPAIDSAGNSYVATSHIEANVPVVRVSAFDNSVELLWQTDFPLTRLRRANKPSLVLSDRGLEVFWILDDNLFSAVLSLDGDIASEPQRISGNREAIEYVAAVNGNGARILWFSGDRSQPGLYSIDPGGNIATIDKDGYRAQILFDTAGDLHAVWKQNIIGDVEYRFYYAQYPGGTFVEDQQQLIHTARISVSSGIVGPEIGLDESNVYLFWSQETRTGLSAGQVDSLYVSFPFGGGENLVEKDLPFPNGYNLVYSEAEAALNAGVRAYQADQSAWAIANLTDMFANPVQSDELVIGIRTRLPYLRNKQATQVGLVFLDDSNINSYQLLSFTPGISVLPTIQSDEQGYLHLTWLEQDQSNAYRLYYSSTAPVPREALDKLGNEDAVQLAGESIFGILSGLVLIPLPILWAVGPALLTFITGPLRKESEPITAPGTLITLIAGVALYWFLKLVTLPGMVTYVPFSAWIPILPKDWFDFLRYLVPILIGLIGLFFAWHLTYRRSNNTPLFFVLYFAMIDGLLSMAVYGVLVYNAI